MNNHCENDTSSANSPFLDYTVADSKNAKYVNAGVHDFIWSENAMNCCVGTIMPDSTSEGYNVIPPEINNDNNIFPFAHLIESCNSYENLKSNLKNNFNSKNVQQIHIKEEIIIDSLASGQDYSKVRKITDNGNAAKLKSNQNLHKEMPVINECNAQENEIHNANVFIKRRKKNDILNLLRMYCTECINTGSNNDVPGLRKKCFKCMRLLRYKCLKCKTRFKRYSTAYCHVKYRCINNSLLKCSKCNYTTPDERNLLSHTKHKHGNNQCTKCGDKFKNYTSLNRHQVYQCKFRTQRIMRKLDIYSFMEYFCKTCDKIISTSQHSFFQKCNDCMQYTQMQCTKCKYLCRNNIDAYVHLKFKCKVLNFSCNFCNFRTPKKLVLEKHLIDLHLPQKCKVCDEICSGKSLLKQHKHKFHKVQSVPIKVKISLVETFCSNCNKIIVKDNCKVQEKCSDCTSSSLLYQCKICTKRYTYKSSIYSHYYFTHGSYAKKRESSVKCSICENMIPFKDLRNHIKKSHTVIKCSKCNVKCENYDSWIKHKTQECSFKSDGSAKCSMCDFLTTNKDLEKHIRYQHTAVDCSKCGMKLANSSMLKQHLRIECIFGAKANINCPKCNMLIRKINLNRHIAAKHALDVDNQRVPPDHNSNFHSCTLCGYVFFSTKDLQMHTKLMHSTCMCPQCGMKCDNFYYMKRHQLHECIFSRNQQSSAKNCEKIDINVYCSKCCVAAKLIYGLKVSTCSVCQNELQYQCGSCKNNFKFYAYVKRHITHVCGVKRTLSCPKCDHKEKTNYTLQKHIKNCVNNSNNQDTTYILSM